MRTYRIDLQLPAAGPAALAVAGERARAAAEDLAREGTTVRWVRAVYVAERDAGYLVLEADSRDAVGEAGRRAALEYERITEEGGTT